MKKLLMIFTLLLLTLNGVGQTIDEVRKEIIRQGLPHPEIVLAQARLESGNFTSYLARIKHNILGIRHGKHYASYETWQDCIADYKKRISSRYKQGEDYYCFLRRIRYAQSSNYIQALKKFK